MRIIPITKDIDFFLSLPHIGIDEAGRGCLAGPVVAAAVLFPHNYDFLACLPGLNDSKKLSHKMRVTLAPLIMRDAIAYGVGLAWPEEIDLCNIVAANFRAMARAVARLRNFPEISSLDEVAPLYVDGNLLIKNDQWENGLKMHASFFLPHGLLSHQFKKNISASAQLSLPRQTAFIKGDARIPSIAAASVLAKVRRDTLMTAMDKYYPGYNFAQHKGYATKIHRERLVLLGASPLHRRTFLKKAIQTEEQLYL